MLDSLRFQFQKPDVFTGNKKAMDALKGGGGVGELFKSVPDLDDVSELAKSLITGFLCVNPKKRLSAHQALMVGGL